MSAIPNDIATKVHQGILETAVKQLFPSKSKFKINVRAEGNIRTNGSLLELDIWIPDLKLAFEFQDEYHYITAWYSHESLVHIMKKDSAKLEYVHARGETLILVPCWWDGTNDSLLATVSFYRPDLAPNEYKISESRVIPFLPPKGFFTGRCIPGVPELMLATFPKLPSSIDFSSHFWWMGEKYDGIRFCWNSDTEGIYTRTGVELKLHESFYNHMPSTYLDGELWFGRGFFMVSQQLLRIEPTEPAIHWPFLRMPVFDEPSPTENLLPFEERYAILLQEITLTHPFINISMRIKCVTRKHMINTLRRILKGGGEGIILRKPKSIYHRGRSENLLKLKAARGDMEALVVSEAPNFFVLKLLDGKTIHAPKPKWNSPKPKKGDIVTVEYLSFSNMAAPVSPKIVRIRKDVVWQDAVRAYAREGLKTAPTKSIQFKTKMKRRLFFENYARRAGFHPYSVDNWYRVSRSSVMEAKGGKTIMQYYNNSLVNALVSLFPELEFKRSKFSFMPQNYWQDMANRREFLREVAIKRGFDPLVAENWYTLTKANIMHFKGVLSLLKCYNGSLSTAIMALFPEIGLEEHKFKISGAENLESTEMRRNFLINFAHESGFDPLVSNNWYSFAGDILAAENAGTILSYYGGDVVLMLTSVFPDIGLDTKKLADNYSNYWTNTITRFSREKGFDPLVPDNWYSQVSSKYISVHSKDQLKVLHYPRDTFISILCSKFTELEKQKFAVSTDIYNKETNRKRTFFERFAKQKKFDPRIADNWYPLKKEDFVTSKGISSILVNYKGSIVTALLNLFPDVSWRVTRFQHLPSTFWSDQKNRRMFFAHFAAENGFDPLLPKNWISIRYKDITALRGGKRILSFHYHSLSKALADLFPEVEFHSAYYKESKNRRTFFVDFAASRGFDASVPDKWYSIKHRDILAAPGGKTVLSHYGGNYKAALFRLFPELNWKPALFS